MDITHNFATPSYFCHSFELLSLVPPAATVLNLICSPWETFGKLPWRIGRACCAREEEKRASQPSGCAEANEDEGLSRPLQSTKQGGEGRDGQKAN